MICDNLSVNGEGHLTFGGMDTVALAKKHGTPLYLMDEDRIRRNMRTYLEAMRHSFGEGALPLYASKAASFKEIYRIAADEGIGIDVVSSGEIFTAHSAGFPMERAYFHSNNKTDSDIAYAMETGVGYFVVDSTEELDAIQKEALAKGIRQKVLLRLTPGIDPHTYEAVATGKVDSKFGSAIETGQADAITAYAIGLTAVELCGFHCHVGSQVFDSGVFIDSAKIMLDFIALMKKKYGFVTRELDLGGGLGVRYLDTDPTLDIASSIEELARCVKEKVRELGLDMPLLRMEPGRSIVADAGMTLYTVGTLKRIPGYKNYVSVDGGMTDNPRFALYRSPYTVLVANRMRGGKGTLECSVVGRCCESGDIIQENVTLDSEVGRGDTLAVLTTGAYNYAMSSNYNRIARPPIVMLKDGADRVVVKRETLEDICRNDI